MKSTERPKMSAQEERLRRMIINFTAAEARKEIKWEVNKGRPIPSEESIEEVILQEAQQAEDLRQRAMQQACSRTEIHKDPCERVTVSFEDHPSRNKVDLPDFEPAPSDRLKSRARLLSAITSAGRTLMQRNRVENRIRKAQASRAGTTRTAVRDSFFNEMPEVSSVGIPVPAVTVVRLAPGIKPIEVHCDMDFQDQLPLYTPMEYKVRELTPHPIPEHPYLNSDPPDPVDMYKPGEVCEPEAPSKDDGWEEHHFNPPPSFESHLKVGSTFLKGPKMEFFSYGIKQEEPVTEPRHRDLLFAQDVKQAVFRRTVRSIDVLDAPIPTLMSRPSPDDLMSDTEDEEAEPLAWERPGTLKEVASYSWMPSVSDLFTDEGTMTPTDLPIHTHDGQNVNTEILEGVIAFKAHIASLMEHLPLKLRKIV